MFRLTQHFHGYRDIVSSHDSLDGAVRAVELPEGWKQDRVLGAQETGPEQWTVWVEVYDPGLGRDTVEVATIVRV